MRKEIQIKHLVNQNAGIGGYPFGTAENEKNYDLKTLKTGFSPYLIRARIFHGRLLLEVIVI